MMKRLLFATLLPCAISLVAPLAGLTPPVAATDCWRPTMDDVDRISWGRPAKKKGTGSRGVPHRLNDEERSIFDAARKKGFVEIAGSGWRRQRSDAPLVNTYRSWCDARGVPAIYVHKSSDGIDEVVADLSPLRTPLGGFDEAAVFCLAEAPDGVVEFEGRPEEMEEEEMEEAGEAGEAAFDAAAGETAATAEIGAETSPHADETLDASPLPMFELSALADAYREQPIHRLPMYAVAWVRPRPEAKAHARLLAQRLGTAEAAKKGGGDKGRVKAKGAPRVKPGKSRRSGGYGIG